MPGLLLAQATSDNAPGGADFTLWFPLGLFVIVAAILWVLYTRPHRRIPPRQPVHAQASESPAGRTEPGYTATGPPGAAGQSSHDSEEPGAKGEDKEAGQ